EAALASAAGRFCGRFALIPAALCTTFSVIAAAQGRWAAMESWSTDAQNAEKYGQISRNWRLHYLYLQARARWHSGNIEGLRTTYEDSLRPNPFEAPAARPYRLLVRGILRTADRAHAQAAEACRDARREEEDFRVTRAICSAGVMLAYVLLVRGQANEAMDLFGPFLAAAEVSNVAGHLTRENPIVIPLLRRAHERKMCRAYAAHVL